MRNKIENFIACIVTVNNKIVTMVAVKPVLCSKPHKAKERFIYETGLRKDVRRIRLLVEAGAAGVFSTIQEYDTTKVSYIPQHGL